MLLDVRDGTSTPLAVRRAARVCAVDRDGRRALVRLTGWSWSTWIGAAAAPGYGDPVTDAALLREVSPASGRRITAPPLLVLGADDTDVPLGEAEQIVAALRARGRAPRLLVFPGEGHEVRGVTNREPFGVDVVRWVLGPSTGVSDPD